MSDGFNPYQPQTSDPASALPNGQRPAVATVFGILNLVFGIMGICGTVVSAASFAVLSSDAFDPEMKARMNMQQFDNPIYFGLLCMQMAMGTILAVVVIISGIGLLKFKPWGRKLANFYAVASLLLLVIAIANSVIFQIMPAIQEANNPGAGPEAVGGAVGGTIGGVLTLCFGTIYPVCILVFLNRRQFVQQIQASQLAS